MDAELNLIDEELKKIQAEFNSGNVFTEGSSFCGTAISNFRDNLYVILDFSSRKINNCDNVYYEVNNVIVAEKAVTCYSNENLSKLLEILYIEEFFIDVNKIDDRDFIIVNNDSNKTEIKDIYLLIESLVFDKKSLNEIQKRLFKFYKKNYCESSDVKYKNIGKFNYIENTNKRR